MDRELQAVLADVAKLDDARIRDGVSHDWLEFEHHEREFRINGNREGLIRFARQVLQVAAKDFSGAHAHLDEANGIDRVDLPLVICLKDPP
jgi:hypothetical protein